MNDQADSSSYLQRVLTTAGLVVLALAVLYPVLYLAHVLLLVFAGVLVAVFLGGLARYMSYFTPLSRPLSLAVVVLALLGVGIGFSFVFGPHLASQIAQLADRLPNAVRHFQHLIQESEWTRRLFAEAPALTTLAPSLDDVLGGITNVFSQTLSLLTQAVVVVLIGIYGAAPAGLRAECHAPRPADRPPARS